MNCAFDENYAFKEYYPSPSPTPLRLDFSCVFFSLSLSPFHWADIPLCILTLLQPLNLIVYINNFKNSWSTESAVGYSSFFLCTSISLLLKDIGWLLSCELGTRARFLLKLLLLPKYPYHSRRTPTVHFETFSCKEVS